MDPHPLANLFKRPSYDEPISSDLSALDYLYEVLLYKVIHDSSLNEKHDCNDVIINSINVNYVNDMQNPKLGDDDFLMSTTHCNDHDWGDASYDLENLFMCRVTQQKTKNFRPTHQPRTTMETAYKV